MTAVNHHGILRGYPLLAILLLLSGVILAVDLIIPLGVAVGVPYVLVVLLAQWSGDRRHILASAVAASLLTVVGYLASPEGGFQWMVLANRGLALFAIWVTALLCYGRKGIEEMLRNEEDAKRELEAHVLQTQKLDSLGVMAGGIAHDFNNLLMGILGYADLAVADSTSPSEAREYLGEITLSAERAADLSRQMLAYSGKGRVEIEVVDPNSLVKEMRPLVRSAISKNVLLDFNLEESIPAFECDATQIRQVLMNLITNAAEAMGESGGTITVSTEVETIDPSGLPDAHLWNDMPDGEYVSITVRDTGQGIDEEALDKVFDPFYTTKFTGRGLGLSTVMGIVRGHRGRVQIESEPGEGTSFKVSLPVSDKNLTVSTVGASFSSSWTGEGLVLLVDDEDVVRKVTGRMLEELAFSVITAPGGEEAVGIFRVQHDEIVCVILDMTMPGMNGELTGRALRMIDPTVPLILASGYDEKEVMGRVTRDQFADIIQKPYKIALLGTKLQKVLHKTTGK